MALASPDRFRITVNRQEVLPDHGTIDSLRNQFIGNLKGLTELERTLDQREAELVEIIKNQDNKAR